MTEHTNKNYEEELVSLKQTILKMGGIVEEMIRDSVDSLINRNVSLADKVVKTDLEVDQLEIDISDLCVKLLALHQPAASDLRFVTIGLRICNDLERMGDLASNIAKKANKLSQSSTIKPDELFIELTTTVQQMVKRALDSFVNRDVEKAKQVLDQDDEADDLAGKIHQNLVDLMQKDSPLVPKAIQLLLISRHLERLGDHATNIAEEVVFMVKGQDIRHGAKLASQAG